MNKFERLILVIGLVGVASMVAAIYGYYASELILDTYNGQ